MMLKIIKIVNKADRFTKILKNRNLKDLIKRHTCFLVNEADTILFLQELDTLILYTLLSRTMK